MTSAEIQALTDEQLAHAELGFERALVHQQFRHRLGQLENTSVLGLGRRDIARAQTELTRRETAAGLSKGSLRVKHAATFTPSTATPAGAGGGFLKGLMEQGEQKE